MTESSKICQVLKGIKDALDTDLLPNDYISQMVGAFNKLYPKIGIKTANNRLAIFKYGFGPDFTDPVVQEARGIIIDLNTLNVLCWPFRKFGKWDEPYADTIDWDSAVVQEKKDGSIIKLWWNCLESKWEWSTDNTIYAEDAPFYKTGISFMEAIKRTKEYHIIMDILSGHQFDFVRDIDDIKIDGEDQPWVSNITYIFELTSPDNRIVVQYHSYRLYLIGARNKNTGVEYNMSIRGVISPKKILGWNSISLEKCIRQLSTLNYGSFSNRVTGVYTEGYVIVDKNFNRIKIKSREYMMVHGLIAGEKKSVTTLIDLIYKDRLDVSEFCSNFPEIAHIISYYVYQIEEMKYELTSMIDIARRLNSIFSGDRKEVGKRIGKKRTAWIGFYAIDHPDLGVKEIMDSQVTVNKLYKWIPEYTTGKFADCFQNLPSNNNVVKEEFWLKGDIRQFKKNKYYKEI